ncbi:MAG: tetratricopeptide repeat protein [Armatimonadetes bacterium]|nr:tetratricopeptide repeat protein [Armatimonadota bacterium]
MGYVRTGESQPEACPSCGSPLRREFNFCPACGERVRDICPNCRADVEPAWAYCAACGVPLAGREEAEPAEAAAEPSLGYLVTDGAGERAEAHNTRGSELYERDDYEEAVREFSAAVDLAPHNPVYRVNLAVALSEMGEHERAVPEFEEALRLDPSNVGAYLQLGYTYQEMERPRQAVDAWKKVLQLAPDSPEAEEAQDALENI